MTVTDLYMSRSLQFPLIPNDGKTEMRMRFLVGFVKELPRFMSVCIERGRWGGEQAMS